MQTRFEFLTGRDNKYLVEFEEQRIHKDMLAAFKKLQEMAKQEADIDLAILSSFRSFDSQAIIWNKKVDGERKIFDDNENIVNPNALSEKELIDAITRFSAIPGASRHHWGTDIDVYDRSILAKEKIALQPSEYSEAGVFSKLTNWLDKKIEKNESCGFYKPYSSDQGGIHPEAWHLSYSPLSLDFQNEYTIDTFIKNISESQIKLKESLLQNAENLYDRLLVRVNLP